MHILINVIILQIVFIFIKELLSVKYSPWKLKKNWNNHFVTREPQEDWDYKATERQQDYRLLGGTAFEGLGGVPKELSSIRKASDYKLRSHQSGLRERPMPENNKSDTEEKCSISTASRMIKKNERKKSEIFQETSGWVQQWFRRLWRGAPVY